MPFPNWFQQYMLIRVPFKRIWDVSKELRGERLAEMGVNSNKANTTGTSGPGLWTWITIDPNQELVFSSFCENSRSSRGLVEIIWTNAVCLYTAQHPFGFDDFFKRWYWRWLMLVDLLPVESRRLRMGIDMDILTGSMGKKNRVGKFDIVWSCWYG